MTRDDCGIHNQTIADEIEGVAYTRMREKTWGNGCVSVTASVEGIVDPGRYDA